MVNSKLENQRFTVPHICFSRTLETGIAILWASREVNITWLPYWKGRNGTLQVCSHIYIICLSPEIRLQRELIPKSRQFWTEILYKMQCCLITCTKLYTSGSDSHASKILQTRAIHTAFLEAWNSAEGTDGRAIVAVWLFQIILFLKYIDQADTIVLLYHEQNNPF